MQGVFGEKMFVSLSNDCSSIPYTESGGTFESSLTMEGFLVGWFVG